MDAGGDWDKTITSATSGGVSGTFLMKAQAARADQVAKIATMTKEQLVNESTKNDNLAKDAIALQIPENYSPEAAEQVKQMGISPEKTAATSLDKQSYQQWAANQPPGADKSIQAFQLQADVAKQKALLPGELKKVGAEASARGAAEIAMLDRLNKQSQQGGQTVAPGMSKDTTDQAATTYHNTGTLPAVGRGQAGVAQRTAIM